MDIDSMTQRFLSWPLPADVCADAVACQQGAPHRTGTNLLTHAQARQMIEHVCSAAMAAKDAEIANGREQEKWLNRAWAAEKARAERAAQEAAARVDADAWRKAVAERRILPEGSYYGPSDRGPREVPHE